MSNGMRIFATLALLLAATGMASAQNAPCPECDADGPANENNSYSSIDLGAVTNDTELLADTDLATTHLDDEKGFWAWLSICLSAWVQKVGDLVGVETDVDAHAEAYVSEDGIDLDATVYGGDQVCAAVDKTMDCAFDFDRSELGDLDGMTWETMADVNAERDALGLQTPILPGEGVVLPSIDSDLCLRGELELATCG